MLTVIHFSDDIIYEPFSYRHLGSLAYIGNSAVFDFNGYSLAGELVVPGEYYKNASADLNNLWQVAWLPCICGDLSTGVRESA